jgi:hypothetical protein
LKIEILSAPDNGWIAPDDYKAIAVLISSSSTNRDLGRISIVEDEYASNSAPGIDQWKAGVGAGIDEGRVSPQGITGAGVARQ